MEDFLRKEYADQLMNMLERIRTGKYTQDDMDQLHFDNVTPEVFIMKEGDTMDPKCKYCDEHRGCRCNGREYIKGQDDCEKFHNKWDEETCQHCVYAQPVEDDKRHIFCPKKNEKMNVKGWCIYSEKDLLWKQTN